MKGDVNGAWEMVHPGADPGLFKGHYKISQLKGNTTASCCVHAYFVKFHDVITDISFGRP